jgi:hypothetical protein
MKTLMLIAMLMFELVLFYYQLPRLNVDILLMPKLMLKQMPILMLKLMLRMSMCRLGRSVVRA